MSHILRRIFMFLLVTNYDCEASKLRNKFVYEKEISEHCLRRVVPSVFLGRQVMDAYSQVLYFSKMDLPYSCFISVRAESGSNIILVVQLLSGRDLKAACEKDPNQLLVFELGETFGGYWGPQELTRKSQITTSKSYLYTIKHVVKETKPVIAPEIDVNDSDEQQTKTNDQNKFIDQLLTETHDFITIDVPLVNISGRFEPGQESKGSFFEGESLDMGYNFRPSPQGTYITTEVPLVQFSMDDDSGWNFKEARNPFGLSWNKFTSDKKIKQKNNNMKIPLKLKFKTPVSRWLIHDNISSDISGKDGSLSHEKKFEQVMPLRFEDSKAHEEDVDIISIEELMSAYNRSGSLTTISEEELEREVSQLLDKLSSFNYNQSAYIYINSELSTEFRELTSQSEFIATNFSLFTTTLMHDDRKTTTDIMVEFGENLQSTVTHPTTIASISESTETEKVSFDVVQQSARPSTNSFYSTDNLLTFTSSREANTTRLEKKKKDTTSLQDQSIVNSASAVQKPRQKNNTFTTTETLQVVDHESWENVVRAAPVIAGRLDETMSWKIKDELENKTKDNAINQETSNPAAFLKQFNYSNQRAKKKRKKRFIQGIMIEDAKPHTLTTKEEKSTTTTSSLQMSDIQQFAQLVELVDDDIHDRAALRYLSQYVGRPMFNLCQYEQPKPRYVHLFNSSRLVISIGNFTLRRMQLVITPAKRLLVGKSRCEQSHLECQVNGNRVCIDAMCACDGVANCGETDIYDEDRLMCGGYMGLRHNVCLAAVTFLAVLLTLIYMVHYWLGRCVPKVSEAFFIYTEGDENVLYLDSIMRSPNDVGFVVGKTSETFDTAELLTTTGAAKESQIYSCIKKCFPCFFKKRNEKKLDSVEWDNLQLSPSNTTFSFPEIEIRKMMNEQIKDASVQTGESLEMKYFKALDKSTIESKATSSEPLAAKSVSPRASIELKRAIDELSRLKFFNKSRKYSLKARPSNLSLDEGQKSFTNVKPSTIQPNHEPRRDSEETEITSLSYADFNRHDLDKTNVTKPRAEFLTEADVHAQKQQFKKLRFNEDVVNIPRDDNDSEEEISALQYDEDTRKINTNTFEESEPNVPSTSRDFKRFWVGSKGKKKKKKETFPRN